MSEERFLQHLGHMRAASLSAMRFVDDVAITDFLKDERAQYAVAMCLVVIGENAKQAVDDCPDQVAKFRDIEWQKIRGMRNQVAHGYSSLDFVVIWDTVKSKLPELVLQIDAALAELGAA